MRSNHATILYTSTIIYRSSPSIKVTQTHTHDFIQQSGLAHWYNTTYGPIISPNPSVSWALKQTNDGTHPDHRRRFSIGPHLSCQQVSPGIHTMHIYICEDYARASAGCEGCGLSENRVPPNPRVGIYEYMST